MAESEVVKPTEEENKVQKDDGVKNAEEENKDKDDDGEGIYLEQLPNRIVVARNRPLSYYVDRSRRILRMEEELYVCGRASSISMSCALVEVLKRQKIAKIAQVATGMNVEPFFNRSGDPRWSQPTAMITFKLTRGEFAKFVADFHQRKVIEIFETKDKEHNGVLSFDEIDQLKIDTRFSAKEDQIKESKEFLSQFTDKKELDLPNFIKFASILIHPLLKDKEFKKIAADIIEELDNPHAPKVEELPQR